MPEETPPVPDPGKALGPVARGEPSACRQALERKRPNGIPPESMPVRPHQRERGQLSHDLSSQVEPSARRQRLDRERPSQLQPVRAGKLSACRQALGPPEAERHIAGKRARLPRPRRVGRKRSRAQPQSQPPRPLVPLPSVRLIADWSAGIGASSAPATHGGSNVCRGRASAAKNRPAKQPSPTAVASQGGRRLEPWPGRAIGSSIYRQV